MRDCVLRCPLLRRISIDKIFALAIREVSMLDLDWELERKLMLGFRVRSTA